MDRKVEFINEWMKQEECFAELCRKHGVSRQTGYAVVKRFEEEGWVGLEERSRAPHDRRRVMEEEAKRELIGLRVAHPGWGPRKLKARLEAIWAGTGAGMRVPAASTIGEMLEREGLIYRRRRKPVESYRPEGVGFPEPSEVNQTWGIDYKGWFRTGDGKRCEPLTMNESVSRKLLRLVAMGGIDGVRVRAVMESAFREYGLPVGIRSDGGAPFASSAPGGLSELSVWWILLGIRHERIAPGKPSQNGRLERFHLSLIRESLDHKVGYDLAEQGRIFARYRSEFNQERPHQALGMRTPDSVWTPSPRPYPAKVPAMEYGTGYQTRIVNSQGSFAWQGVRVPLSPVLAGQPVGLREIDDDVHEVQFGPVHLGMLDGRSRRFVTAAKADRIARAAAPECKPDPAA